MSQFSTLLASSSGPAYTITLGEKEYHVSFLTQNVKSAFEKWVKLGAMDVLKDLRDVLSPEEWREALQGITDDITTKKYAFHGKVCQEAINSSAGSLKLSSLLFGVTEEEMLQLASKFPAEVQSLLEAVLKESAPNA